VNKSKRDYFDYLFAGIGSVLIAYVLYPILTLFGEQIVDIGSLLKAFRDEVVLEALRNTLFTSLISTFLALILGVPLGYLLAKREFKGKALVQGIVDLPVVIPHSVVGIMLLLAFSRRILDSYTGIIMVMLFVSVSFVVNSSRDGFLAVDPKLEYVARSLGASKIRVFFTVSLPIAFHSIATGGVMAWARAVSEVGAIMVVAYYPKTAQVVVMEYFNNYGLAASRPIAVILMGLSLGAFALLRALIGRLSKSA